ncbi:hypothetical protein niasHS_007159 [Heterodera schachtii]|uniref:Peptidase metallopeptidase domain-containing protein n=1 Tax=Heterodera schachtii TaxID=97005 RepID=A0ABD2JL82_HETSC
MPFPPFLISPPFILISLIGLSFLAHSSLCSSTNLKRRHQIAKRFVLHRHKWDHCQLSWSFRDPFLLFPSEEQFRQAKKVIGEAIRKWEVAAAFSAQSPSLRLIDASPASRDLPLNSRRVADIDIFFAEFGHGDSESFDGTGGLVAHSAYPPLGIVHFDASERWQIGQGAETGERGRSNGIGGGQRKHQPRGQMAPMALDLRYVALHEIGHALGLRHSTYRHSVMNSYYRQNLALLDKQTEEFKLSKDDKAAIWELFGEKCHQKKKRRKS